MMKTGVLPLAMGAVGMLVGCANHPVGFNRAPTFRLSPNLYVLYVDRKGAGADVAAMKTEAVAAANSFAQAKGKAVLPVTLYGAPVAFAGFTTVSYQFRLVEPGTPGSGSK